MLCPSTPAAPLFARTLVHATASVLGANTLSIRLYHLPPSTPLPSADSMRSVHTDASTHDQLPPVVEVSVPCLASSALPVLLCSGMAIAHPPSYPAFPRMGFAAPSSRGPRTGAAAVLCGPGPLTPTHPPP